MSYTKLEVWQLARTLVIDIHTMSFRELPKIELYEEGLADTAIHEVGEIQRGRRIGSAPV